MKNRLKKQIKEQVITFFLVLIDCSLFINETDNNIIIIKTIIIITIYPDIIHIASFPSLPISFYLLLEISDL
jgi:hypothetical protein